jgi:DNA-binding NarL/FixJ family response regulator
MSPTRLPSADAPPYRVLLVEDHAIVREGIAHILGTLPAEFVVCGQAADSRTARALAGEKQPHLVILDYFLGDGEDGARLLADLRQLCRTARILVLSITDEQDLAERALRAGAHGYIAKTQGATRLLDASRALLAGGLYISPELQVRLLDRLGSMPPGAPADSPLATLTERELQIFRLLAADLSLENIASRLGLSARTIGTHRENIKNKLGHQTAAQLAAAARRWLHRGGAS